MLGNKSIPLSTRPSNGQAFTEAFVTPQTDNRIIQDWLDSTSKAIEALRVWQAWLRAWQHHPNLGQLPDDLFMSVIQDALRRTRRGVNEAGLMGWLDGPELDALRAAVTGGER